MTDLKTFDIANLVHIKKLKQGKQGVTGIVEIPNSAGDKIAYVYKISQYMNYLTNHEYIIQKGLEDIYHYCPNFCKAVALMPCKINTDFRNNDNPFSVTDNEKFIILDVLFMEYIENSVSLFDLIADQYVPINVIFNCIKQILLAIYIAQKQKKLVHYDLHSENILIRYCDPHQINVYIIDENNIVTIPTGGIIPIIIDFGFAYSSDIENKRAYISLAYTNAGSLSPAYDQFADMKKFLVSLTTDFNEMRQGQKDVETFTSIMYNTFKKLDIDWEYGWDIIDDSAIINTIFEYVERDDEPSKLFFEYPHFCVDIVQSLITLPYAPVIEGQLKVLKRSYDYFVDEFKKIEDVISNPFYSLYALRLLIDSAYNHRPLYHINKYKAIENVHNDLFDGIRSVSRYCSFKNVSFDVLLCSLYMFQDQLEYQLYTYLNKEMKRKYKEYAKKLNVLSLFEMFAIIDINIQIPIYANDKTFFRLYDLIQKDTYDVMPSNTMIRQFNSFNQLSKGFYIYHCFKYYNNTITNAITEPDKHVEPDESDESYQLDEVDDLDDLDITLKNLDEPNTPNNSEISEQESITPINKNIPSPVAVPVAVPVAKSKSNKSKKTTDVKDPCMIKLPSAGTYINTYFKNGNMYQVGLYFKNILEQKYPNICVRYAKLLQEFDNTNDDDIKYDILDLIHEDIQLGILQKCMVSSTFYRFNKLFYGKYDFD